jgi:hypothetical protein
VNFPYTPDNLKVLERTISPDRLAYYLAESDGDLEAAIRLYELNARLSAGFYGPLQGLEVVVRNAIDEQFTAAFGNDWTNLQTIRLQAQQEDDVRAAIAEASDQDGVMVEPTHADVIAELKFGFWVGVLGPRNEVEIWRKALWRAFPQRPKGTERKIVQGALNSIRRLRNRIAHHRRILHRDLVKDHATILEVAGWVCPITRDWIASLSTFDPNDLPVPQQTLPFEGLPATDPIPPATPRATLGGRSLLGIKRD